MYLLFIYFTECLIRINDLHILYNIDYTTQVAACSLILLAIAGCLQHQDLEFLYVHIENNGILTVYNECYKAT